MSFIDTDGGRPFADPGAEPRHHHRVGAQVVEEVGVGRHPLGAHRHVGAAPRRGTRARRVRRDGLGPGAVDSADREAMRPQEPGPDVPASLHRVGRRIDVRRRRGPHPVGLVDGVEVALAEVGGDGDGGEVVRVVPGQPVQRAADDGAGGAAEEEPAAGQAVAGADGVGLLDVHDLVDVGLVEQRRADAVPRPGIIRRPGGAPKVTEPTRRRRRPARAGAARGSSGRSPSGCRWCRPRRTARPGPGTRGRSPVPWCGSAPSSCWGWCTG